MKTHSNADTSRLSTWRPRLLVMAILSACDTDDLEADEGPEVEDEADDEPGEPGQPEGHLDDLDLSGVSTPTEAINCNEFSGTGYVKGQAIPLTLVTVDGEPVQVDTANAFYQMAQAAAKAGVTIKVGSGFRTMAEQQYLYNCYINCNCNSCNVAAKPGFSNHQSGHALDLNTKGAGVLNWLNKNGAAYGFTRTVPSEDWHWEWWGGGPGGGPCGEPPPPPKPPVSPSINRDYNGDGADDIFWYAAGDAVDPLWLGAKSREFTKTSAPNVQGQYFTVAGDFNGDGRSDAFFYAPGAQPEAVWNGTAAGSFIKSTPKDEQGADIVVGGVYTPIAGNFNGDAYSDIVWYAPGDAHDYVWYGLGGNKFKSVPLAVGGDYLPVAGDFDGDERTDILWYSSDNQPEAVWYGRPSTTTPFDKRTTASVSADYLPFAGDFNADGRDDIFWYAPGAKADSIWNGTTTRDFHHSHPSLTDGTPWNVTGSYEPIPGDFDGDGATDIVWYGPGGAPDSIWFASSNNRFADKPLSVGGVYAPI